MAKSVESCPMRYEAEMMDKKNTKYMGHFAKMKHMKAGHNTLAKLGSGARFKALKNKLSHRKGVTNPGALAAYIGRKKYGKKRFQQLAARGK